MVGLVLGYSYVVKSWNGQTTARVYLQGRVVAGTTKPVQDTLLVSSKVQDETNIISSLKIVRNSEANIIGLNFGNYITEYGQSICSAYRNVEIILFGNGLAVSGEPPRIIIEGLCPSSESSSNMSLNLDNLFPVFLISECNKIQENDFYIIEDSSEVKFSNIDFPLSEPDWIIEKITFSDDNNTKLIEFDVNRIRQILSQKNKDTSDIKIICE